MAGFIDVLEAYRSLSVWLGGMEAGAVVMLEFRWRRGGTEVKHLHTGEIKQNHFQKSIGFLEQ